MKMASLKIQTHEREKNNRVKVDAEMKLQRFCLFIYLLFQMYFHPFSNQPHPLPANLIRHSPPPCHFQTFQELIQSHFSNSSRQHQNSFDEIQKIGFLWRFQSFRFTDESLACRRFVEIKSSYLLKSILQMAQHQLLFT